MKSRGLCSLVLAGALATFTFTMAPSPVAAGADDYQALCSSRGPAQRCIEIDVYPKAVESIYGGQHTLKLRCTRRVSGDCRVWRIVADGVNPPYGAGVGIVLTGRCVVKQYTIPNDGGSFGGFAGGSHGFLDSDCDGVDEATDRAVPANSFNTISPGAGFLTTALLANVTMLDGITPGYVTADSCQSIQQGPQTKSSGNHDVSNAIANLAVVPLGSQSQFCLYNSADVNILIDVQGYFEPAGPGRSGFVSQAPVRLIDTRKEPLSRPGAGALTRVETGLPAGTSSAMINLTMAGADESGYITAAPCSQLTAGPQTQSSGNFTRTTAIANLGVVSLDADGAFCIYNSAAVHLIADLQGSFKPEALGGLSFSLSTGPRRLDTRSAPTGTPADGSITRVETGAAPGTEAVLANLTMTGGTGSGYITADLCSALVPGLQTKSTGNFGTSTAIANLAVVPVDASGAFCVYNSVEVDLLVDVQGAFSTSGTLKFRAATPRRIVDSRLVV